MSVHTKTINGIEYTFRSNVGEELEVEYANPKTGLNRVIRFDVAIIGRPTLKRLDTEILLYDRYPNGDLVKVDKKNYPTPEDNFDVFEQTLGVPIKQSIINGIMRIFLGLENVYDQQGNLI